MTREMLTNLADRVIVMPNPLICYACSAVAITVLVLLARHNRNTGWRRKRNNTGCWIIPQLYADYVDGVLLSDGVSLPPELSLEPERLREQLLALDAALRMDEASSPIVTPPQPQVREQ